MKVRRTRSGLAAEVLVFLMSVQLVQADDISLQLRSKLAAGDLTSARESLSQTLAAQPRHSQARFGLGMVQLLQAVEALGQEQFKYGALNEAARNFPVLRLPLPPNPNPAEVSYQQVRDVFNNFQKRVLEAEATLAAVDVTQDCKLPLDVAAIRLDISGDGRFDDAEKLLVLFGGVNRITDSQRGEFLVTFDAGDVPWLRGYCHFLCAFCDMVLAYDHQRLFDLCGQLIYPRTIPSQPVIHRLDTGSRQSEAYILDIIAGIHLMDFPVREPERMKSAHSHLLAMIRTSRESWKLILAEADNDQEWLPNPTQTGALRIPVTRSLIDGWHAVLLEMEQILNGERLIPFWRDSFWLFGPRSEISVRGRGVNLHKFFHEPHDFDLILALQGSGMTPYLEDGPLSTPETWRNLSSVFGGQFFGFATWFN